MAELTYLAWLRTEVLYPRKDSHPSQYSVLTGLNVEMKKMKMEYNSFFIFS